MENKSKYIAKIKKLLRLAKGTSSPDAYYREGDR